MKNNMKKKIDLIKKMHNETFGEDPHLIAHAPGMVNLIGEHTDYSEGFSMPMAIDMGITLGISQIPNANVVAVYSMDYDKKIVSNYENLLMSNEDWFNYAVGIVKILLNHGYSFSGIRISFTGDLPQGVGLSSSAAIGVAVGYSINELFNLKIPKTELAQMCQEVETKVVGVKRGIKYQFISLMGEEGKCLFVDCRKLEYRSIPMKLEGAKLVITNSNVPHKMSNPQYNEKVHECEEAVKILSVSKPGTHLRDFSIEDLEENKKTLTQDIWKRALHVISENQRVIDAEKALNNNDLSAFGTLLNESHASLKNNYEVSSPELDWLAETAQTMKGCYGSRMIGSGYGGCVITLMEETQLQKYMDKLKEYEEKFGFKPVIYEVTPQKGAKIIEKNM
jgi:galactokinase